ncbi:Hsp70 ATPase ssc1 [Tulasnella sp. 330]|nr:Hsp70 ATPase ssc1 [Tulasnella sp. 330]KAG8875507.1 Hsp70 ATPase ssc1 [Tulasnella sp. 331]KAG8884340.1 Hsp70 ATPase ssc1 [Tulasnella sp. 332]
MRARSAPYDQLHAVDVLIISSFIYLLNVARNVSAYLLCAGSIGLIGIGMLYGTPIAQLMHLEWQKTIHDLGYIGLILLIFEGVIFILICTALQLIANRCFCTLAPPYELTGGLFTRLEDLQRNIVLSIIVACTGVIVPIGLSFLLLCIGYEYSVQDGFACAAALATTSLGTTFFILSTQSPHPADEPDINCPEAVKDIRHTRIGSVLLSAALIDDVIGLVLVSILPAVTGHSTTTNGEPIIEAILRPIGVSVALFIMVVVRPVRETITSVIRWSCSCLLRPSFARNGEGSVMLFMLVVALSFFAAGAFYAGASLLLGAWVAGCLVGHADEAKWESLNAQTDSGEPHRFPHQRSFRVTYERYIQPIQTPILEPFFFASVGFAVPFLDMWDGKVFWRGIVYASLMTLGKMVTGLWILAWPVGSPHADMEPPATKPAEGVIASSRTKTSRPLYPSLFLSLAMVARGEIGLIVAQLGGLTGEPYLVVMWAILLCTVGGAVSVGSLLRRKKKLCLAGSWG